LLPRFESCGGCSVSLFARELTPFAEFLPLRSQSAENGLPLLI
jgi:hypothetical protein